MGKAKTLVADLEGRIMSAAVFRKTIWLDRCPPDVQDTFREIKKRFASGQYDAQPRSVVADAIASAAGEHLGTPPSRDAVERWLKK